MVDKQTLPSSPSNQEVTSPKSPKTTLSFSILPRLITPDTTDDYIVKLLVEEDAWCVGSCNGWVLLLDGKDATPFLVSASSSRSSRFYLPPIETFPCQVQVDKPYFMEFLRKSYISKAVVVGTLETDDGFTVVVLYNDCASSRLAFCKKGDCAWNALPGGNRTSYHEIMVHGEALYALTTTLTVQTWDLTGPEPVKTRHVRPSIPKAMWEADLTRSGLCFGKFYLVESLGEVLLVVRDVGYLVNGDGVAVEESDLLSDEHSCPLVCPYRTLMFHVYKADFQERKWVQVEDLGDRVLFLGCNNSISLAADGLVGYQGNSIYFSDDNWEQMNEDYLYGGHDLGKFNLHRGKVEPIAVFDSDRIDPPPFWIVPS